MYPAHRNLSVGVYPLSLSGCVLSEGVSSEAVYFHGSGVLS